MGLRCVSLLAPSSFLASAAGSNGLQLRILPQRVRDVLDCYIEPILKRWVELSGVAPPPDPISFRQRNWDNKCTSKVRTDLLTIAIDPVDRARLLASQCPHSADWLHALPMTSVGLRLDDETIRIAVGLRLGTKLCEPHTCTQCKAQVDSRGLHGLACRSSAGRNSCHSSINDIIWRAMTRAGVHSSKEPTGLIRNDGKRPDGASLIPWSRGRCVTWDVTVPDTFAASHLSFTSVLAGAAANRAAELKHGKYATLQQTHIFTPVAVETSGAWNNEGRDFIQDLGRRLTLATGEQRETAYLFQRISVAIQRGNAISFSGTSLTSNLTSQMPFQTPMQAWGTAN